MLIWQKYFVLTKSITTLYKVLIKVKIEKQYQLIYQYYNKKYIEGNIGAKPIVTNIGVIESTHKLRNGKSIRIEAQKLWSDSKDHNWVGGTFEFNFNSKFKIWRDFFFHLPNF